MEKPKKYNYDPINNIEIIKNTSPCKNCHHQDVPKDFCDCQEIKAFQQGIMGHQHFLQENSPLVFETAY